jgi:hypothetical protein
MEGQNNAAKHAFYYMLSLVSLIFVSLSVGMIVFQIINKNIIDPINLYGYNPETLKVAISMLVIASPVYFFFARLIHQNLAAGSLEKESDIRKWLTYFIMFVASVVVIGWLIGTLFSYLNGDLSTRFALKAVSAIAISSTIFAYYLYDIRREQVVGVKDKVSAAFFYGALVAVVIALVSAFVFVESPTETRNRRQDERLLYKFDRIASELDNFYNNKKVLPKNLEELRDNSTYLPASDLTDQTTGKMIEYKVISEREYELCGEFKSATQTRPGHTDYLVERWPHEAGFHCLSRKVTVYDEKGMMDAPIR